jgi:hypothetical protein
MIHELSKNKTPSPQVSPQVSNGVSQDDLKLLKAAIAHIIHKQNPPNFDGESLLSPRVVELMSCSLGDFILSATDKFIAGAIVHGGDIRDRNIEKELQQELLDLFWYNAARQWPAKTKI